MIEIFDKLSDTGDMDNMMHMCQVVQVLLYQKLCLGVLREPYTFGRFTPGRGCRIAGWQEDI